MKTLSAWNLGLSVLLILLSSLSFAINYFIYKYPGNNYFPPNVIFIGLALLLMYWGFSIQFGKLSKTALVLKESLHFFLVMAVLALTTTAAQYTPFMPIDAKILYYEAFLQVDIAAVVAWTQKHPFLVHALGWVYDSLPLQMTYIPLLILVLRKTTLIREYYFHLLFTGLLGFSMYYFFPTTAPASILHGPFSTYQQATGLKFYQIHNHIPPTTLEGGMVAFPSFHAIWAWYCSYLLRDWKVPFLVAITFNLILVCACVLLGWHYPLDIVASIIIILLSHGVFWLVNNANGRSYSYMLK